MVPVKAALLAVGTELTTGQITNRNSPWIAERLVAMGMEIPLHETVPDEHALIRQGLERCERLGDAVFVTGGLGPTSDDFTRDIVAEWAGLPLEYHEPSWAKITERLGRMGIPVAESNRQQCYFPRSAAVVRNPEGTADAFTLRKDRTWVCVLPGPPREIAACWPEIERQLREAFPLSKAQRLFTWQCIGKSEAELGELTERALQGGGFKIGYRAHRPYVEIKVWCPEEKIDEAKPWLDRLEAAIAPWVATRQGEDLARLLVSQFRRNEEIEIVDSASGGILAERLGSALRLPENADVASRVTLATEWVPPAAAADWVSSVLNQADPEVLTLALAGPNAEGAGAIGLREGAQLRSEPFRSPYRWESVPELRDRGQRYVAELALKRWLEWLNESTH